MDLVHLAHLITVLVQLIQQAFKQIYLLVGEKNDLIEMFIFICIDHMKNMPSMSTYGGGPHIWYSPILP